MPLLTYIIVSIAIRTEKLLAFQNCQLNADIL